MNSQAPENDNPTPGFWIASACIAASLIFWYGWGVIWYEALKLDDVMMNGPGVMMALLQYMPPLMFAIIMVLVYYIFKLKREAR